MSDIDRSRLETAAARARTFFGPVTTETLSVAALPWTGTMAGTESNSPSSGLPNERDVAGIVRRLSAVPTDGGNRIDRQEAEGVARTIVLEARRALEKLEGAADQVLKQSEALFLEAVVHIRGRPAVKVLGNDLEDIRVYPDSGLWAQLVDQHRRDVVTVTAATAAVRVNDRLVSGRSWVQGTAFLIDERLAVTNRHVLFPEQGTTRLARRLPGTTSARIKGEYETLLDFAFDSGPPRTSLFRVVGVPFVAHDADPIDVAVLEIEPVEGARPRPLAVSAGDVFDIDRLYVVGHPGFLESVPEKVLEVFGRPDERKRVSFGNLMDAASATQTHVVHDASTVGGYSGGPVLGFMDRSVRALHYWGDGTTGNRAITSQALRAHPVLGPILPAAGQ